MRKIFVAVLILLLALTSAVWAGQAPKIYINDKELISKDPPVVINGRTLVPMRAVFQSFNMSVGWNNEDQTIVSGNIYLQINNPIALVSNKEVILDVPPRLINGRTYVPLRFISESLGKNVMYDEKLNRIDITYQNIKETEEYNARLANEKNKELKTYGDKFNKVLSLIKNNIYLTAKEIDRKYIYWNYSDIYHYKQLKGYIKETGRQDTILKIKQERDEIKEVISDTISNPPAEFEQSYNLLVQLYEEELPLLINYVVNEDFESLPVYKEKSDNELEKLNSKIEQIIKFMPAFQE